MAHAPKFYARIVQQVNPDALHKFWEHINVGYSGETAMYRALLGKVWDKEKEHAIAREYFINR